MSQRFKQGAQQGGGGASGTLGGEHAAQLSKQHAAAPAGPPVSSTRATRSMTKAAEDTSSADHSARPRSAAVFKRGMDEGHPQMGDASRAGSAAAKKNRAALLDISNTRDEDNQMGLQGKELMALGTRELDALMARPLSSMEARLQYEQSRLASTHKEGLVAAPAAAPEVVMSEASPSWRDIDANEEKDPLMCGLYIDDIYGYMRNLEVRNRPHTTYMEAMQRDINPTMRGILVDWLVEVAEEYELHPETLFLTVNFIDRCLSKYSCARPQLQLVGVTCMLIAAKFEEIYAPQVSDFCYITDGTYVPSAVLDMERKVLETLGFNLSTPTVKTFIMRYLKAAESTPGDKLDCLASFLAELTLLEYAFLQYKPSMVAAAAVMLALHCLNRPAWSITLEHYAVYTAADLQECMVALHQVFLATQRTSTPSTLDDAARSCRGAPRCAGCQGCQALPRSPLPSIREKYSSPKFKSVAGNRKLRVAPVICPASLPEHLFAAPAIAQ